MAKKKASRGRKKAANKTTAKGKKARRGLKAKKKAAPKGRKKARRSTKKKSTQAKKPTQVETELREQWAQDEGTGITDEYISTSSGSEHFGI